jgi:hypothetical protein
MRAGEEAKRKEQGELRKKEDATAKMTRGLEREEQEWRMLR